jgi:hypothetical protein
MRQRLGLGRASPSDLVNCQYPDLGPSIFSPFFHLVIAVDRLATVAHYLVSFEIRPLFHVHIPSAQGPTITTILAALQIPGLEPGLI